MTALPTGDLEAALTFVGELNEVDGPEPFTTELLDRLQQLVPCDEATYWEADLAVGMIDAYASCSADDTTAGAEIRPISQREVECINRYPTIEHLRRTGRGHGLAAWSQLIGRRRRMRYEVNESYQREYGIVDQAMMSLVGSSVRKVFLHLNRTGRDFGERDLELLELLEPHLATRMRTARLQRRFAALEAGLAAGNDGLAVLLTTATGEIELATPAARELLERYFGAVDGRVPFAVGETTSVQRNGTRLLVEPAGNDGALLLREEPAVSLTRRERDVLCCIAAGKTTAETARLLWVTDATVSKHLEHVYRKLGVTSRTAALAKLRGAGELDRSSATE